MLAARRMMIAAPCACSPTAITTPWSDNFTRSDSPTPGLPWYVACNGDDLYPSLQIVSNTLALPSNGIGYAGLLLDSDDFDLTFDVHYAAANGHVDDVQVAFRRADCWDETKSYLWATMPDTGLGGTHGIAIYEVDNGVPTSVVAFNGSGGLFEGSTYTMRIHVHGTTLDTYINGSLFQTATIDALPGQRAVVFLTEKLGTYIDNVSIS